MRETPRGFRHAAKQQQSAQRPGRNLHVGLATSQTEVLEAQKLRYRVFADRDGRPPQDAQPRVDRDLYDAFCGTPDRPRRRRRGRIVGTYRILSPSAAREVGNYYSENEFDLTRLRHLKSRMVGDGAALHRRRLPLRRGDHPAVVGPRPLHAREQVRLPHRLRR